MVADQTLGSCTALGLQIVGDLVFGSFNFWGVAVFGFLDVWGFSVRGLQCGNCGVWRLQSMLHCVLVAMGGRCNVWELQCVIVAACGNECGSCGVWKLQCVGIALRRSCGV